MRPADPWAEASTLETYWPAVLLYREAYALAVERRRLGKLDDGASAEVLAELAYNLCRLGYCEQVVKLTEVARIVTGRTGRNMRRQRISSPLNAVRITDPTIEVIAKGLGFSASELTKPRPK